MPARRVRRGDLRVTRGTWRGLRRRVLVRVVARFARLRRVDGDGGRSSLRDLMAALAVARREWLEPRKKFGRRTCCAGRAMRIRLERRGIVPRRVQREGVTEAAVGLDAGAEGSLRRRRRVLDPGLPCVASGAGIRRNGRHRGAGHRVAAAASELCLDHVHAVPAHLSRNTPGLLNVEPRPWRPLFAPRLVSAGGKRSSNQRRDQRPRGHASFALHWARW